MQPARPGQVQCPMFDPLLFLQRRVGKWWGRGIHREALNFPGDGRWSEVFYPTGAARCFGKLISRPEIFTGWPQSSIIGSRSIRATIREFINRRGSISRSWVCSVSSERWIILSSMRVWRELVDATVRGRRSGSSLEKPFDRVVPSNQRAPIQTTSIKDSRGSIHIPSEFAPR